MELNDEMFSYLCDMDDATLYDVFYEAGTILGGTMVALEREYRANGDTALAEKICNVDITMIRERASVNPDDRDRQIESKIAWTREQRRLRVVLDEYRESIARAKNSGYN